MARFHLRRAMQDAHSPDELCRLLGQLVPQEDLRDQFVDDAIKIIAARQDQSMGAAKAAANKDRVLQPWGRSRVSRAPRWRRSKASRVP